MSQAVEVAVLARKRGALIPFGDVFARSDGALGNGWTGATWAIASGVAKNTPTPSANQLTNGNMEAGDPPSSWSGYSGAVPTRGAERTGGAGSHSLHVARNGSEWLGAFQVVKMATGTFFSLTGYRKLAGAQSCDLTVQGDSTLNRIYPSDPASWTPATGVGLVYNPPSQLVRCCLDAAADGQAAEFDDVSLQTFTAAELMLTRNAGVANVRVAGKWTVAAGQWAGVVARLDSATNPQNYLLGVYDYATLNYHLVKMVAGVPTVLQSTVGLHTAGAFVELRCNGTTVQLWADNAQVGTDQTVSDAGIVNNTIHGAFSSGSGNSLAGLFISAYQVRSHVFQGTSITAGSSSSDAAHSYVGLTSAWLREQKPYYGFTAQLNKGVGGMDSWGGLIRLQADVVANTPDVVCLEFAPNDQDSAAWRASAEALIRRLRGDLPNARLVALLFGRIADPAVDNTANTVANQFTTWQALCNLYAVPYVDVHAALAATVPATHHASDLWADVAHPTDAGHALASAALRAAVLDALKSGVQRSGALPARLYDNGDYEHTPTRRSGVDNDGETGVWSTVNTTQRRSSAANATIKWTVTAASFGLSTADYSGTYTWKIDNGAETPGSAASQPTLLWSGARGSHTLTIKVVSGTLTIAEFEAI